MLWLAAEPTGAMRAVVPAADDVDIGGELLRRPDELDDAPDPGAPLDVASERRLLQRAMTNEAGVLRSAESLDRARKEVARILSVTPRAGDPATWELRNLAEVGAALLAAAAARTESRGAHTRSDHPLTDPDQRHRLVVGP